MIARERTSIRLNMEVCFDRDLSGTVSGKRI